MVDLEDGEGFEIRHLTDLVDRLTALLDEETALMNAGRIRDAVVLLSEKQALTAAVEQGTSVVRRPPNPDDPYYEADMEDLRDAVRHLHDAAGYNDRALKASLRATDRIIRAVVSSAAKVRAQEATLYTAEGVARGAVGRTASSKAVNHTL